MVLSASQPIQTDTWVKATWEAFVGLMDDPRYEEGRGYFDQGNLRIEMAALGAGHGRQHSVVIDVVSLFVAFRNLRIAKLIDCSFRKAGERSCQPDVAFYIGPDFLLPPQDNAPIDVDLFGSPTLAVEIAASSLSDDLGVKRLLYERLDVREYWVVDVARSQLIAFSITGGRSGEIQVSEVLPGLELSLVEMALTKSQTEDDGAIVRWLMETLC